jgi:hypothetical protein
MESGDAQDIYNEDIVFMASILTISTPRIRTSRMIANIWKAIRNMCHTISPTESAPRTSAHEKSVQFSEALAALPRQSALQRYAGQSQSSAAFSETLCATYHVIPKEDSAPRFHGIGSTSSGVSSDRTRSMPRFKLETFSSTYCETSSSTTQQQRIYM